MEIIDKVLSTETDNQIHLNEDECCLSLQMK